MTVNHSMDWMWTGYPKKRRKKAISCAICYENMTENPRGVCNECLDLYKLGQHAKEVMASSEVENYYMKQYTLWVEERVPGELKSEKMALVEFIELMSGRPAEYFAHFNLKNEFLSGHLLSAIRLDNEGDPIYESTPWTRLSLTQEQAAAVRFYVDGLEKNLKKEYQHGYRRGSGFVAQLASGELTMEELNRATIGREKE